LRNRMASRKLPRALRSTGLRTCRRGTHCYTHLWDAMLQTAPVGRSFERFTTRKRGDVGTSWFRDESVPLRQVRERRALRDVLGARRATRSARPATRSLVGPASLLVRSVARMLVCACRVWSSAPSCPVARVLARPPVCGCGFAPCFPVFPVASCTHVLGCCSVAARLLPGCCSVAARLLLGCCSVAARLQFAADCAASAAVWLWVWGKCGSVGRSAPALSPDRRCASLAVCVIVGKRGLEMH